jgi:uncharacterized protein (DUF1697 family)
MAERVAYVALLRAVNVGGTGKLPMSELAAMCEAAGFDNVRTYIASGNVVFTSALDEAGVKNALEARLAAYANSPVGVLVRTASEMAAVRDANPFPTLPGNRVVAIFLDAPPPFDALSHAKNQDGEDIVLGAREIYIAYTAGMADSRLAIPAAKSGTGRNMNTISKLAQLGGEIS